MLKNIINNKETFDVVNKNDEVIRKGIKEEDLHINNDITRVVTIFIFDQHGQIYLAQRSPNKIVDPLKYEAAAHGRVNSWENYEKAAHRETIEELWVKLKNLVEVAHMYVSFETNVWIRQHYKKLFIGHIDEQITVNKTEIFDIKKFSDIFSFFDFYTNNQELFSKWIITDINKLKKFFEDTK